MGWGIVRGRRGVLFAASLEGSSHLSDLVYGGPGWSSPSAPERRGDVAENGHLDAGRHSQNGVVKARLW